MSYILDALRKSERQRRLGNIPSLDSEPLATSRSVGRNAWLASGIAVAAASAVVIWWLWQPAPPPAQVATGEGRDGNAFAALGAKVSGATDAPGSTAAQRALQPASPRGASTSAPATRDPAPVAAAPAPSVVDDAAPPNLQSAPPAPQAAPAPTPYARLEPEVRAQLPALTVNAVSFSEDPARRFVMINEGIYREGQDVAGVTIARIQRAGVVLRYGGREFLLAP